jgi:hypothetical protein
MYFNNNLLGPISEIPVTETPTVERQTEDVKTSKTPQCADKKESPNLDKLIQVYQKAKADYSNILEVAESHRERSNSVRFLRDTAENLLRYLSSVDKDHELIPEIKDIIKISQAHANQLAGGRKRKFEHSDKDSRGSPSVSPYRPQYGERDRYLPSTERWDRSYLHPRPEPPRYGAYAYSSGFTVENDNNNNNNGWPYGRADTYRPL